MVKRVWRWRPYYDCQGFVFIVTPHPTSPWDCKTSFGETCWGVLDIIASRVGKTKPNMDCYYKCNFPFNPELIALGIRVLHRQGFVSLINSAGLSLVLMRPRPRLSALTPQELLASHGSKTQVTPFTLRHSGTGWESMMFDSTFNTQHPPLSPLTRCLCSECTGS